ICWWCVCWTGGQGCRIVSQTMCRACWTGRSYGTIDECTSTQTCLGDAWTGDRLMPLARSLDGGAVSASHRPYELSDRICGWLCGGVAHADTQTPGHLALHVFSAPGVCPSAWWHGVLRAVTRPRGPGAFPRAGCAGAP